MVSAMRLTCLKSTPKARLSSVVAAGSSVTVIDVPLIRTAPGEGTEVRLAMPRDTAPQPPEQEMP